MLTRPQAIGLTVSLAVALAGLLPAALVAFWWRRVRREAADEERQRLELLEALGLPLPPSEEEEVNRGKAKRRLRASGTSSIPPSWRMYLCWGAALPDEEIMARSKAGARLTDGLPTLDPVPAAKTDKGKQVARPPASGTSNPAAAAAGEPGGEVAEPVTAAAAAGRRGVLLSKFSTDSGTR